MRDRSTAPGERRWLLLRSFYSSWKRFLRLFENYESRVAEFTRRYRTDREQLRLEPDDLATLIDFKALEDLRDREVSLLRQTSHDLFRSSDATDRFDHSVSIIYHELSALKEEHYTLREEFVRKETIEYDLFYREVNEYYPKRLRHIRNLYEKADRRLRQLLPAMQGDVVVVRSLHMFGEDLVGGLLPGGLADLYGSMYAGGPVQAHAEAASSFRKSGFLEEALEAYEACLAAEGPADGTSAKGRAARANQRILAEARAAVAELRAELQADGAPQS